MLKYFHIFFAILLYKYCIYAKADFSEIRKISVEKNVMQEGGSKYFSATRFLPIDNDESFFYAICQQAESLADNVCNITKITASLPHGTIKDSCLNIKIPLESKEIPAVLWPVMSDNVLIFVSSTVKTTSLDDLSMFRNLRITNLNMKNCSVNTFPIISLSAKQNDFAVPVPVFFNDTFEIAVRSKTLCRDKRMCRLSYRYNGQQIGDPKPLNLDLLSEWSSVAHLSSEKGYYVHHLHAITPIVVNSLLMHVDQDGEVAFLATEKSRDSDYFRRAYSSMNELFSLCSLMFKFDNLSLAINKINCRQINTRAVTINETIEIEEIKVENIGQTWITIHTLANGEILLATGVCQKGQSNLPHTICQNFQIRKIGTSQRRDRSLEIDGLDLACIDRDTRFVARITENDADDEYCIIFTCFLQNNKEPGKLNHRKWCIPKKHIDSLHL